MKNKKLQKRLKRWGIPGNIVLISGLSFFHWYPQEIYDRIKYDVTHNNEPVRSKQGIDSVLTQFPTLQWSDLPEDYKKGSQSDQAKFKAFLKTKTYYVVQPELVHQKIVGQIRIRDLMGRDRFYRDKSHPYLWLIDKRILYKVLELQQALDALGYDQDAFIVKSGHRTPQWNKFIGGAKLSRHIHGQAVDLKIGDINQDGGFTQEDKQIVLDLVNKKIIGNKGGVGRYPGTRVVHIDVRGYRARWDSY